MTQDDPVTVSDLGPSEGHTIRYGSAPDGGGVVFVLVLLVTLWVILP